MAIIEGCHFQSMETTCAGTLMLPDGPGTPPVIVMAHGFANIRKARLPAFAERFVNAGYAVFLFDYRTFGDSEGEPRHLVNPYRQIEDWEAAIRYVRTRPEVDSQRMVLWGTSFSGGHVLQLAAGNDDFATVISQIPHVSGLATTAAVHPWTTVKSTLAALLDAACGLLNRTLYSPVVGEPGERAAITGDHASQAYFTLLPEDANWENKVLSRSFLYIPLYSPGRSARRINVPTLIIAARHDSIVPASAAYRTARKIPRCTFHLIECDHFAPYAGEHFEHSIALQIDFLREHVPVTGPTESSPAS
jgi:pimeloyl-ACP methyl ester carboxylesterase